MFSHRLAVLKVTRLGTSRLLTRSIQQGSSNGTHAGNAAEIRQRLLGEVKNAMKAKDTLTSTTLRSVLAEIYAADKDSNTDKVPSSAIFSILRKAYQRRTDSAKQFIKASREDLAAKETQEADILAKFLPPLLSEREVDRILATIITSHDGKAKLNLGQVFKAFYTQVDKSSVDPNLVKARATALLS